MTPKLIKTTIYPDKRGFFKELYLKKKIKFNCKFTAISSSKKNVIRGLHYQSKKKTIQNTVGFKRKRDRYLCKY